MAFVSNNSLLKQESRAFVVQGLNMSPCKILLQVHVS